jgi:hypothetical protein
MSLNESDDDAFTSLGGSLMKDLLADLNANDDASGGWLSLEQLELELDQLQQQNTATPEVMERSSVAPTAASMVVTAAQLQSKQTAMDFAAVSAAAILQSRQLLQQDAWTASLERFAATSSAQEEFLKADSQKKQTMDFITGAHEYSLVYPPPIHNVTSQQQQILVDAASKLSSSVVASPPPRTHGVRQPNMDFVELQHHQQQHQLIPKTPHSSTVNICGPTPPPSAQQPPRQVTRDPSLSMQPPPQIAHTVPVAVAVPQPQGMMAWQQHHAPHPQMMNSPPPPMHMMMNSPPPPTHHMMMPPRVYYCNTHPQAPPIPAHALESRYMRARDISYVVHTLMKPLLTADENAYDALLLQRQRTGKENKIKQDDATPSRAAKSKEWSAEHAALGHVVKTNVLRPRALIAKPTTNGDESNSANNKQRAILWKARIRCDQAYQAYDQLVSNGGGTNTWRTSGQVPQQLIKLLKCFGIGSVNIKDVDTSALELLLKLNKGRVLLARVLERALLPPNAAQALLPAALNVLLTTTTATNASSSSNNDNDDRCFAALARVVTTLPNVNGSTLLNSLDACKTNAQAAFATAAAMACVHALLQRGATLKDDPEYGDEWTRVEQEFMVILAGM